MLRVLASMVAGLSLAFVLQPVPSASAQGVATSSQTYVCPKCGKIHTRPTTTAPATQLTSVTPSTGVVQTTYTQTPQPASNRGGGNVFQMLNAQRTRQGAPALMYDPTLQSVAQMRAEKMARMGVKNHPPGSFAPGRYEGVGWNSSFSPRAVSACFINDRRMRYAGAAMARGRDGVYFAVVYR